MVEKAAPAKKAFKLAKGKGLQIPGVSFVITDENVNDANVIKIITRAELKTGNTYFGRAIIEK